MFSEDNVNKAIEWIIIITFFIGNLIIAKYTLGQIKDYIFVGGMALILPFYLVNIWGGRRKSLCSLLDIIFGGFIILIVISVCWSEYNHIAYGHTMNMLIFVFGIFLYYHIKTLAQCKKERMLMKFIGVFFITGVLQSFMGIAQFFFDKDMLGIYKTLVTGTLMNSNLYGGYLCISLAAGCFLFYQNRFSRLRYFYILSLVFMFSALLLCHSRGAILSLLLSAGLIFSYYLYIVHFKDSPAGRRKVIVVFAVMTIVSTFVFVSLNKSSSQGRLMKILIGYSMVKDHPLTGIGYGRYGNLYPNYQIDFLKKECNREFIERANEDGTTNNQFLKILIELGIIGLVIFLFLLFLILKLIFTRRYMGTRNPSNVFIAFSELYMIFHMVFDEMLRFSIMAFIFPLLCAFIPVGEIGIRKKFIFMIASKSLASVVILVLLIISVLYIRHYPAVSLTARAKLFLSTGDFSNSAFFAQRALDLIPDHTPAKIILGRSKIGMDKSFGPRVAEGIAILETVKYTNQSRDIFLALSVGYLKSLDIKRACEYALKAHELLPSQMRPRVMLYLLKGSTSEGSDFLHAVVTSHPDRMRIASLVELVGKSRALDFLHSPQIIQLVDLIMLAH